jgi:uncharacterized membrane protein YozB (DUF420 family)
LSTQPEQQAGRTFVVGLVADPGLPGDLAQTLSKDLPAELRRDVDGDVSWDVRVLREALPLNEEGEIRLSGSAPRLCARERWDYMVCLTELPRRVETRPLLYDVRASSAAAVVSLPALGLARLRGRVLSTIVQVVRRLHDGRPAAVDTGPRAKELRGTAPARRVPVTPEKLSDRDDSESYVALTGVRGRLRLLSGMVRTNRPWRLVPSLSRALAAAAATAAFGIFYSSIWSMAAALSPLRLATISVVAIGAMVVWLVVHNGLWDRPRGRRARERAVLYNAATLLTLFVGVTCMYALLFGMTLLAGVAVIDAGYLETVLGHPAGVGDYISLTWLSTSMGTVAGALGSSVESEEAVRRATYGRRELERQARTGEERDPEAEQAYEETREEQQASGEEDTDERPRATGS